MYRRGRFATRANELFRQISLNKRRGVKEALKDLRENFHDHSEEDFKWRDLASVSRGYAEIWRNGWDDENENAIQQAMTFGRLAIALGAFDFYTHWKLAYATKHAGRTSGDWSGTLSDADQHYSNSIALLDEEIADTGQAFLKRNRCSVLIDRAEMRIYQGDVAQALTDIETCNDWSQPWHRWVYAFALVQQYDVDAADRAMGEMRQIYSPGNTRDMYNNDMRLTVAAALWIRNRGEDRTVATETVSDFANYTERAGELPWSIKLEIQRGCFEPGGDLQLRWDELLTAMGLSPTRRAASRRLGGTRSRGAARKKTGTERKNRPRAAKSSTGVKPKANAGRTRKKKSSPRRKRSAK